MIATMRSSILAAIVALSFLVGNSSFAEVRKPPTQHYDLVVYGGTPAGVIAAVSASREGLNTLLLIPGEHLGGMVTGGLSATDLGDFHVIGGAAREFFMDAANSYGTFSLDRPEDWRSEPHIAEAVFRSLLKRAGVHTQYYARLREHNGVEKQGVLIRGLILENGARFDARMFIDASYEGDLMAQARIAYSIGREGMAVYGESLAGVRRETPKHQFQWPIAGHDQSGNLLPEVSSSPLGEQGEGDKLVQAYNFRLILTRREGNKIAFPKPADYSPARFTLLAKYLNEFETHMGRKPTFKDVTNPVGIPGDKADFNNNGPFSTDYIGHSARYPDASYSGQRAIWNETLHYVQSFLYFLSTDKQVPASLQQEVNTWGLAADEFQDTGHWPNQLYVREGRRMIGMYVMKQSDLQTERTKQDSIGMGSYNSDSHNVQRVIRTDGSVMNEGDVQVAVKPYEIPYRVILPKEQEAENLLVPVCFSASHVAYSSLRMEPQYMIMGQAAGVAASIALHAHTSVQQVSVETLQKRLHEGGAILHFSDVPSSTKQIDPDDQKALR